MRYINLLTYLLLIAVRSEEKILLLTQTITRDVATRNEKNIVERYLFLSPIIKQHIKSRGPFSSLLGLLMRFQQVAVNYSASETQLLLQTASSAVSSIPDA